MYKQQELLHACYLFSQVQTQILYRPITLYSVDSLLFLPCGKGGTLNSAPSSTMGYYACYSCVAQRCSCTAAYCKQISKQITTRNESSSSPTTSPCSWTSTLRSLNIWFTSIISLYKQTTAYSN